MLKSIYYHYNILPTLSNMNNQTHTSKTQPPGWDWVLVCVKEGGGCKSDAHLRSLPKPKELPLNSWHTKQHDNHGLNTNWWEGTQRKKEGSAVRKKMSWEETIQVMTKVWQPGMWNMSVLKKCDIHFVLEPGKWPAQRKTQDQEHLWQYWAIIQNSFTTYLTS